VQATSARMPTQQDFHDLQQAYQRLSLPMLAQFLD